MSNGHLQVCSNVVQKHDLVRTDTQLPAGELVDPRIWLPQPTLGRLDDSVPVSAKQRGGGLVRVIWRITMPGSHLHDRSYGCSDYCIGPSPIEEIVGDRSCLEPVFPDELYGFEENWTGLQGTSNSSHELTTRDVAES